MNRNNTNSLTRGVCSAAPKKYMSPPKASISERTVVGSLIQDFDRVVHFVEIVPKQIETVQTGSKFDAVIESIATYGNYTNDRTIQRELKRIQREFKRKFKNDRPSAPSQFGGARKH